jgi:uncharacterized protein (DUF885 family)
MRFIMIVLSFLLFAGLVTCTTTNDEDGRFVKLAERYIEGMLRLNPQSATWLGDHRFDHKLNDYSQEGITERFELDRAYLDTLASISAADLNAVNRIDYEILRHRLRYSLFRLDTLRAYERNPRRYNPGGAIYGLMIQDFAPLKERLQSIKGRLEGIPQMLKDARVNLKNPPQIHTETAIPQFRGTINMIRNELTELIDQVPEMKEMMEPAQTAAVEALEDFVSWMESDLLPRSTGDFRLGEELYKRKLQYVLYSDINREEILSWAEADLAANQAALFQTAVPLYEKYFPDKSVDTLEIEKKEIVRAVLDKLAEDHPSPENIVDRARQCLQECEDFVREHEIVTLPSEPIEIIVMPEFQRGVAVAYCSSPGPLEEKGKTFYAISPPPSDWEEAQIESYFREYNNTMLYDLTIHEAMPGHYLQGRHANRFKAPTMIRAIFGSGTFSEGWATYCEELMLAEGFGGPELKMQMLKMNLRGIINAIIDQKIHTEGMTEQEAKDLMMNEGFQEKGEAAGKWRRACLSSTQLSTYYFGNREINDIRRDYERKMGEQFSLREFHDRLLSYGSPPPKYLRELLEI